MGDQRALMDINRPLWISWGESQRMKLLRQAQRTAAQRSSSAPTVSAFPKASWVTETTTVATVVMKRAQPTAHVVMNISRAPTAGAFGRVTSTMGTMTVGTRATNKPGHAAPRSSAAPTAAAFRTIGLATATTTVATTATKRKHRPAPRSSLLAPTATDAFLSASNVTLTMTVVTTVMNPTVLPPNLCRGLKRAWQILVAMPNLRTMRPKDSLLSTSSPSPATKFMPDRRNG